MLPIAGNFRAAGYANFRYIVAARSHLYIAIGKHPRSKNILQILQILLSNVIMNAYRIKFDASRFSNNWFYCREKILNKSQSNVFDKKLLTRFSKSSRKRFRFYLSHFYPSTEYSRFASARTLVVFIRNCCDSDIVTHETPGDISRANSTSMVFETFGIYNTNKILKKIKK